MPTAVILSSKREVLQFTEAIHEDEDCERKDLEEPQQHPNGHIYTTVEVSTSQDGYPGVSRDPME